MQLAPRRFRATRILARHLLSLAGTRLAGGGRARIRRIEVAAAPSLLKLYCTVAHLLSTKS
jgi:hypothetical protein